MSGKCGQIVDEIKNGGLPGLCGFDQVNWGSAGAIYEIWKLEPCCGQPCNPADGLKCMVCWYFCTFCTMTKLYSFSLGQECALFPHCLCVFCLPNFAAWFMRYSLRKKAGVKGNLIGDFVCLYFCGPCSFCQELRSVPAQSWDLLPFKPPIVMPPKIILLA